MTPVWSPKRLHEVRPAVVVIYGKCDEVNAATIVIYGMMRLTPVVARRFYEMR